MRKQTQPELFATREPLKPWQGGAQARRTDPQSSHAAAARHNTSGATASHEALVLELVREFPGSTAKQLAAKTTELDSVQVARRMAGLRRKKQLRSEEPEGGGELRWYWVQPVEGGLGGQA